MKLFTSLSNPTSSRRFRGNIRGAWAMGAVAVLGLIGILLLIVAATFALTKGATWATPTGYALFGIAAIISAVATASHKTLFWLSAILAVVGTVVLVGHYMGFF